ncbi:MULTISPECIES: glycosyltransferase family 2 protein [unclassified Caballeronia]|uniref:glycosyltransferase family 2 protein n=1 Tax=unclassified Caballeronia TaxID=2646786 RepID=UPI002858FA33|nr:MULTISPECIES: glycosyltransferase family 2 protein [unclassified Caballeronia]MDR5772365.1 glycosyltransferase family 2 protein [Caballeronia sp. LZ002]MDR5847799.1 glycosyltransferase family 2 protein [Caballeronia sp. LZ003]
MTTAGAARSAVSRGHRVGVAIVNWNSQEMLDRALEALARQTVMPHRVVVVDNASKQFRAAPVAPDNTLYERLDYNSGFARGNNLAVRKLGDCDWIALVNPDAFVSADWIERMLQAAKNEPDYAFFAGKTLIAANPSLLDGAGDVYHVSGLVWRRGYRSVDVDAAEKTEVFGPCAATAMYAKDAFDAVNGFDEDFFCYVEDVDLAFRLRLAGYRCLFVPEATALHVGSGATGGEHSQFAVYHGHRNLTWAYVKNMPGPWFWVFLPLHVMMTIAACALFSLHGQTRTILRAKRDALRGLPVMWRKRAIIQRARVVRPAEVLRVMSIALSPSLRREAVRRGKQH